MYAQLFYKFLNDPSPTPSERTRAPTTISKPLHKSQPIPAREITHNLVVELALVHLRLLVVVPAEGGLVLAIGLHAKFAAEALVVRENCCSL